MANVGFLGCGKIGRQMLQDLLTNPAHKVVFIQDPFADKSLFPADIPVVEKASEELLSSADLVIETATADTLKANIDDILAHADIMLFSVTAFSDPAFEQHVKDLLAQHHRKIYLPHGAILGVDGIADGSSLITSVSIVTTKNPKSLSRDDTEKTVVYEGDTRGACHAYPRNVNVHATCALAGIGFDKTHSVIISDPAVSTNTHHITVEGEGIHFEIVVSSFSTGGVTGKYTPYSAVASMHRVLDHQAEGIRFV